jgi:SAM-dependent methyltransferase
MDLLLAKGATEIIGIDISKNLITLAQERYPSIKFYTMDAEKLLFESSTFDYVYSSLVLDHLKRWDRLLPEVFRVLKSMGTFLFSTTHPVKWSADHVVDVDGKNVKAIMGYDQTVSPVKIFGSYLSITRRDEIWGGKISVTTYSRPISISFRDITKAGFRVVDIDEPRCVVAAKNNNRDYFDIYQRVPNFVIFECIKP